MSFEPGSALDWSRVGMWHSRPWSTGALACARIHARGRACSMLWGKPRLWMGGHAGPPLPIRRLIPALREHTPFSAGIDRRGRLSYH